MIGVDPSLEGADHYIVIVVWSANTFNTVRGAVATYAANTVKAADGSESPTMLTATTLNS